eukprot:scaffold1941_cov377-Prasinococcus_capsulatus_cf.AAC.13
MARRPPLAGSIAPPKELPHAHRPPPRHPWDHDASRPCLLRQCSVHKASGPFRGDEFWNWRLPALPSYSPLAWPFCRRYPMRM